jgi:heptaprenyl diphosphate synthase
VNKNLAEPSLTGPTWLIDDLVRVEDLLASTAGASSHPIVSEPSLHLLNAGGKRVRPALALISSRAGEPGGRATDLAAAAVELVHLATLYHDDVIDRTEVRRGVSTTHSEWGVEVAVLAGDYLFACGCALGAEAGGEVPSILAHAIAHVCEGQIVETATLGDPRRSVDDYIATIRLKTATLFRASCELGATTSGASDGARAALASFGENLGLAFQVIDDLLDLIGDPDVTGKQPGTDLRDGVFTLPVLLACERDGDLAARLSDGQRDLGVALPVLRSTGALEDAHVAASSYGDAARASLEGLPDGEWRETLSTMVEGVLAQV